ncbi:hypothetical protein ABT127_29500 [Streptomyces sp. NPDC001904]|uniref:hypothetical protein n=1 Tax=Streptomyces sp. NPDC001904 TaxID=3154531 RepID=UPI003332FD6D
MTSDNEQAARFEGFEQNASQAEGPLKEVAANPAAYARYLADLQRMVLEVTRNVETLQTHVRVHARDQRVEGDRWGQATLRAMPLERSVKSILSDLSRLARDLEKSAHRHFEHSEKIQNVAKARHEKALEKVRKRNPQLQGVPNSSAGQAGQHRDSGYGVPKSVYDLQGRESA